MDSAANITAVVLAAGMGTRMKSKLPKVLHEVCGKPMVEHVIDSLKKSGVQRVGLVLSDQLDDFKNILDQNTELEVCIQKDRRGTGDAVASSAVFFDGVVSPHFAQLVLHKGKSEKTDHIIICAGDTPALSSDVLKEFIDSHIQNDCSVSVIGMEIEDPTGYGRLIVSSDGALSGIVEHKDASEDQLNIKVCNSGVIMAKAGDLFRYLDKLSPNNAQGEYYLTDIISIANSENEKVQTFVTENWKSFMGVNTPEQKAVMEDFMSSKA